jgi:hypothetical protein
MLKKSGGGGGEGGERRGERGWGHVQEYSRKEFFWKGFFEQAGRILGGGRLEVGEARGEEADGAVGMELDELGGERAMGDGGDELASGPEMDV